MSLNLEAIKAREKAATPGPWMVRKMRGEEAKVGHGFVQAPRIDPEHGYDIEVLCEDGNYPDALREGDLQFIAAARQDIPALISALSASLDREARLIVDLKNIRDYARLEENWKLADFAVEALAKIAAAAKQQSSVGDCGCTIYRGCSENCQKCDGTRACPCIKGVKEARG